MECEELLESIKNKIPDFSICLSDLKAPTAKFVQSYYIRVLEEFDMDKGMLEKPMPNQVQEIDYPDAHVYLRSLRNLYFVLSSVFGQIFVDDFSITDLTEPSPLRTMVLISALNGFHSYADWKASAVDKNIQILFQRKAENDQLRAEYEELKRELNVRASERAQREVHKKELIAIIEEGKNKLLQLKKEDSEIQQEIALSEAAYVKAKQKNEGQQAILQKLESEKFKLESQIVKNPDQLEAKLNSLREKKEKGELEKEQLTEAKQERNRQKALCEKLLHMQEETEVKLKDILLIRERVTEFDKRQEEAQKKIQASTTKEQEINRKVQNLHNKKAQLQEQKMALTMQWENMKAALTKSIEEKSRELDELKKKYGDVDSKVTEMRLKRMEMEETYKNLEKMKEEQVRYYDQLLEDKTAKQDAAIKEILDAQTKLLESMKN